MVQTPWGKAAELRERRLSPGPGTPPAEVVRNQRERLFGAMVAACATNGYAKTTVADLLHISGVSRSSFYDHFEGKLDCFLTTMDELLEATMAITRARLQRAGGWEEGTRRALLGFFGLVAEQPAASRLCLVESYAAGPEAVARMDAALEGFQLLLAETFEERPEHAGMPVEMVRAMIGGLRKMVHTRLHRGTEQEMPELGRQLLELGLSYRPPPRALRRVGRRRTGANGGVAVREVIDGPEEEDPAERIVRATLATVAERGYPSTKIADIAAAAHVSLTTFYAHFDGKAEAFEAALYSGRARMLGRALPAYRRRRGWPEGIRAMGEAMLAHLAADPEFARLIAIDVFAAGPEALERLDQAIESMQRFIDDGVPDYAPQMPPIWREAIISSLYAMLCNRVRLEGVETLPQMAPLATYMVLSPFLGAEAACAVANGGHALPEHGHVLRMGTEGEADH